MDKNQLLKLILEKYLSSEGFNGYPLYDLQEEKDIIIELVESEQIDINFGDRHPNFHIKALDSDSKESQIKKIKKLGLSNCCAYPTKKYLKTKIHYGKYKDKPFTRRISLGEATLNFAIFDLSVLETYRNDPRYSYSTNDVGGQIVISDEFYNSDEVKSYDKILLDTFGFCYEKERFNRAVAVFYRYLANLSSQHQKIWESKEIKGDYILHPDYARTTGGAVGRKRIYFYCFFGRIENN